jgi:putative transcriptional regulator
MSLLHHPPEEILTDHAMGRLKRGQGLVVEAHLAHCPACRAEVERMEAVGGALLEDLAPAELEPDALSRMLARIDAPDPPTPPAAKAPPPAGLEGIGLEDILADLPIGRRRWLAPGVWMRPLLAERGGESNTYLLRGGAGMQLLHHGHTGVELTCILKGAYADDTGRYGAGDFQFADQGLEHQPVAEPDGECICLISAEGPAQMDGLIGRLMQSFAGL